MIGMKTMSVIVILTICEVFKLTSKKSVCFDATAESMKSLLSGTPNAS